MSDKPKKGGVDIGLIFGKPGAKADDPDAAQDDSFDALAETALGDGDIATRIDALKQAIKMCMSEGAGDDEAAEGEAGGY